MRPLPRPELLDLPPAPHGGDAGSGLVDFSTGVCPLPPPKAVLAALRSADVTRYPHPSALPLREAAARAHGVVADAVVAGNGSAELLWALARAFVGPGRKALVLTPAFGEYAQAVRASGGRLATLVAEGPPFRWDAERLFAALGAHRPSLVFVGRPSNPCLALVPRQTLEEAARAHPETLFAVDEAYLPLHPGEEGLTPGPNVALVRSLTKVLALPGVRLGYLVASPEVARAVRAALPPWNVSSPALAAGRVALEVLPLLLPGIQAEVTRLRASQAALLASVGARVDAEGGTFLLVRVGDAPGFTRRMAEAGVRVRDATSLGLPHHVRLGVRPEAEHPRLRAALAHALENV
ncbi:histidinol-phosphate transaminase [Myxococcus sp. RHSTA-1-4]|uniref:pyridoxal phosphate-dependent aminotransferase n=1 Tax=Myxococcus sp. RHSTA-1-4 TaxID=2874601 RepID=UPI001CBE2B93|nr:histidinol-phosphate transaminase [Myxococcus sp. RHSTA-1-4]MBZ4420311.1 histidinol-phosphate aminotransferase family protein [Myxococcus sp. RHSTA-1-4]